MKKLKLTLRQEFTQEEYEILKIVSRILYATNDTSIYYPWVNTIGSKKLGLILHHLLSSCRDFLGSIFTLMHDYGYHSAYAIGASIVEYFIDFSFILSKKELVNSRAEEYFDAFVNKKKPFCNDRKFRQLENRADGVNLSNLYKKTYTSLCSFKHANLAGHLVTRRDNRLKKDRKKFLLQITNLYLEMWQKLRDYLNNNALSEKINALLDKEFIEVEKLIRQNLNF
jgi:hypothetical protein